MPLTSSAKASFSRPGLRPGWFRLPNAAALYKVESRRFVLWLPVCLGIGIAVYFGLDREPSVLWALLPLVPLTIILSGAAWRVGWGGVALAWLVLALSGGFALAIGSAHMAQAPAIAYPMGETVEGRVLELSRSKSGAPRVLLDKVTVYGLDRHDTPARLRLTLLDNRFERLPLPGERVRVYASLLPTGSPVEPGGFDFHRRAFFDRLGGIGLSRGHLLILPPDARTGLIDHARMWLAGLRHDVSLGLRTALPGAPGAFAAAIIVGDRIDIAEGDAEALRASNLAHLLAISGLHMGILTGLVFFVVRLGLALPPGLALCYPTKKWAAVAAILAGATYLMLSGATVATQRAFIMVAVALSAVLLDRPAITLRGLALAATIILLIRPISLLDAGFQMSFAATAALVAGFEAVRGRAISLPQAGGWAGVIFRTIAFNAGALLLSSVLAGLATAPISAYHFNRTAPYGLLSNMLAVPVMGLWIAPFACLAAALAPLGLAGPALVAMGWGIEHVLRVAHWVAEMPGAVGPVAAAPPETLAILSLGGLWFILWRGNWRFAGVAGMVAGLVLWQMSPPRPDLLIAPDARLIGVMQAEARALDHATAQGFAARTWLRRDGDLSTQAEAANRARFDRGQGWLAADLPDGWRVVAYWTGRPDPARLADYCQSRTILVARNGGTLVGPCLYFGKDDLSAAGSVAIRITAAGPEILVVSPPERDRLWSRNR